MIVTNDEKNIVVLLQTIPEEEFLIQLYDLKDGKVCMEIPIVGDYVKADEIAQDLYGQTYSLPYFDNGRFNILIFNRDNAKVVLINDINEKLGIGFDSTPPEGFTYPMIYANFILPTIIFVNLFDNESLSNYHFYFDLER